MKYLLKSILNLICLLSFIALIYPMLCLFIPLVQYAITNDMPANNYPLHAARCVICIVCGLFSSIATNQVAQPTGYYYKRKYGSFLYWVNSL